MSYDSGSNYKWKKDLSKDEKEELRMGRIERGVKPTEEPAETSAEPRGGGKWRRYRFETKAVDDYRPLVFNHKYPWWCSGHGVNGELKCTTSTIVAYLPLDEDLKTYWDDAFNITYTDHAAIEFSERFPKPKYFTD